MPIPSRSHAILAPGCHVRHHAAVLSTHASVAVRGPITDQLFTIRIPAAQPVLAGY